MSGRSSQLSVRRVLVAVDPQSAGTEDLATAARLARAFGAELRALFVKTRDLLNMTELPFETIVIDRGGRARPLETRALQRQFDVMAARARAALVREAGRDITWSFEVVEGYVEDLLLGQASRTDLITFCNRNKTLEARIASGTAERPLLLAGGRPFGNRPVVAIFEGDLRVPAAADRIARSLGVAMSVVVTGPRDERPRLKKRLRAWATRRNTTLTVEDSPEDVGSTARQISRMQPGLVVLSPDGNETRHLDAALAGQPRLIIPAASERDT